MGTLSSSRSAWDSRIQPRGANKHNERGADLLQRSKNQTSDTMIPTLFPSNTLHDKKEKTAKQRFRFFKVERFLPLPSLLFPHFLHTRKKGSSAAFSSTGGNIDHSPIRTPPASLSSLDDPRTRFQLLIENFSISNRVVRHFNIRSRWYILISRATIENGPLFFSLSFKQKYFSFSDIWKLLCPIPNGTWGIRKKKSGMGFLQICHMSTLFLVFLLKEEFNRRTLVNSLTRESSYVYIVSERTCEFSFPY